MTISRLPIIVAPMLDLFVSVLAALRSLLKSEHHQALEILALRQQLAIYKRTAKRPKLRAADRVFWVWLWGAPRIHAEIVKLGFVVSERTVSRLVARIPKPPSQSWLKFLNSHVPDLASVDFFVVYTIRFQLLYVFIILEHERRRVVHFGVTAHPSAEWTANHVVQAFPSTLRPIT